MRGDKGPQGPNGEKGDRGPIGKDGPKGPKVIDLCPTPILFNFTFSIINFKGLIRPKGYAGATVSNIALHVLRMMYENAHQNITYDCAAGVDGFLDLKLEAANEETVTFKGRNVRVVSEVNINSLYSPVCHTG